MPVIDHRTVLQGLLVREAMRRQVISVPASAPLEKAIRFTIKYKVNAVLVTGEEEEPFGVVSKTDLMGAYFVNLALHTPVSAIMAGPPLFCRPEDSLDAALEVMHQNQVHRLYVQGEEPHQVVGVLAYPDIVGLLYRFCHRCRRSLFQRGTNPGDQDAAAHLRVKEVMTPGVASLGKEASLLEVVAALSAHRVAALLISAQDGRPEGVVSKTDLILAYKHGLPPHSPARMIMSSPVRTGRPDDFLALALQEMIFWDLHRLFIVGENQEVIGVLSLSDAARFRSGTCRACLVSRLTS